MEARLSHVRVRLAKRDAGARLEEEVVQVASFAVAADGTAALCGGPAGVLWRGALGEKAKEVSRFELVSGPESRNVSAPVCAVADLPGTRGQTVVALWQSNEVLLTGPLGDGTVGEAGGAVVSLRGTAGLEPAAVGAVRALDTTTGTVAWGTERGLAFAYRVADDLLTGDLREASMPRGDDLVLAYRDPDGAGVGAVSFLPRSRVAFGFDNGLVRVWRLSDRDRGAGQANLDKAPAPEICIRSEPCMLMSLEGLDRPFGRGSYMSLQPLLVSGAEDGCVFVWDLRPDQRSSRLASVGNFAGDPVHSVAVYPNAVSRQGELLEPVVAVGDDAGSVWIYAGPADAYDRGLAAEPWRLMHKFNLGSPIVACRFLLDGTLYIASCEHGVHSYALTELLDPHKARADRATLEIENEADNETEVRQHAETGPLADVDDEDDDEQEETEFSQVRQHAETGPLADVDDEDDDEQEEIVPVPAPAPAPPRLGRESDSDEDEEEFQEEDESAIDLDDAPRVPPAPHEEPTYPDLAEATCYDGYLDEDIPPLPLSQYHEPSLHSSEKIKVALESLKLAKFEDAEEAAGRSPGALLAASAAAALGLCEHARIATRTLTVGRKERMYQSLAPLAGSDLGVPAEPVYQARRAKPQLTKGFRRKSIMQRQREEIEKHRAMKLERELRDAEAGLLPGRGRGPTTGSTTTTTTTTTSSASSPSETTCGSDAAALAANVGGDDDGDAWLRGMTQRWARKEFYLTKTDDGKVGFHHFHSLGRK